eukprot:gnl/Spiro4/25901_TR12902_c0_g1_i1.p1 gnl/Spiro4/25901_TR12902_c0_g1~~gnl/Spiro4/25901_TR12902_c0_g1_i1.p1  ORF type:complete len:545 (+),score=127.62 gnl/Spiro4/25901_TR12902_c0_g1_i1:57-1691(+)
MRAFIVTFLALVAVVSADTLLYHCSVHTLHASELTRREYYSFVNTNFRQLVVNMTITPSTQDGDPDLYMKLGNTVDIVPGSYDWNQVSSNRDDKTSIITISSAVQGNYSVLVYGYADNSDSSGISYCITASGFMCPSGCHADQNHGTCDTASGSCTCATGFVGVDCGNPVTVLPLDASGSASVAGSVAGFAWTYYQVNVNDTTHEVQIDMYHAAGTSGDPDLYVRWDMVPTTQEFDARDLSTDNDHTAVLDALSTPPAHQGTLYIGIYGSNSQASNYQLRVQNSQCPNSCGGGLQGTCDPQTGVCTCNAGYAGPSCGTLTTPLDVCFAGGLGGLDNCPKHAGTLNPSILATANYKVTLPVNYSSLNSEVRLVLDYYTIPTTPRFVASANILVQTDNQEYDTKGVPTTNHDLEIRICKTDTNAPWYASVTNLDSTTRLAYSILSEAVVECPAGGCGTHGMCGPYGCECKDGYRSLDCSVPPVPPFSGFHTWSIVLWFFIMLLAGLVGGFFTSSYVVNRQNQTAPGLVIENLPESATYASINDNHL